MAARKRTVRLVADADVTIEGDLKLPAGTYLAMKTELETWFMGKPSYSPPEYVIEITAEQYQACGLDIGGPFLSEEHDVTKLIGAGFREA